jgi:hypothetical protein
VNDSVQIRFFEESGIHKTLSALGSQKSLGAAFSCKQPTVLTSPGFHENVSVFHSAKSLDWPAEVGSETDAYLNSGIISIATTN